MPSLLRRLRRELFSTPVDALISLGLIGLIGGAGFTLLHWALLKARWAVIQANSTLFAVGRYPLEQQWRLWLLTSLLTATAGLIWGLLRASPRPDRQGVLWPRNDRLTAGLLLLLAAWLPWALGLTLPLQARWWALTGLLLLARWLAGRFADRLGSRARKLVPLLWPGLYLLGLWLIGGGLGLASVTPTDWGGLLLTLLSASFAILLCFPIGVLLALGRRSDLPLLR